MQNPRIRRRSRPAGALKNETSLFPLPARRASTAPRRPCGRRAMSPRLGSGSAGSSRRGRRERSPRKALLPRRATIK
eukprot:15439514-Alexandrium_andersonii.AAC.1